MKASLTFDLSDPDEQESHRRAVKSLDMALVLWKFKHHVMRDLLKYGDLGDSYSIVEDIDTRFSELLSHHGVDLDDLVS